MEMFRFEKVLPLGQTFPFDFGFLPSTIGGEGDPLDRPTLLQRYGFPWKMGNGDGAESITSNPN